MMVEKATNLEFGVNVKKFSLLGIFLLCIIFSSFATSWEGVYQWTNSTDEDNNGKMHDITFVVKETTEPWLREITFLDGDVNHRIFPFIFPSEDGFNEWHKYGEKSPEAESFRYNCKKMNTSPFSPGRWRVDEVSSTQNESLTLITVGAFSVTVGVEITFNFSLDENGKEQLTFGMDVDKGYAKGMFFSNPEPDSDGLFVLKKIE